VDGELAPLPFTARERGEGLAEAQVAEAYAAQTSPQPDPPTLLHSPMVAERWFYYWRALMTSLG